MNAKASRNFSSEVSPRRPRPSRQRRPSLESLETRALLSSGRAEDSLPWRRPERIDPPSALVRLSAAAKKPKTPPLAVSILAGPDATGLVMVSGTTTVKKAKVQVDIGGNRTIEQTLAANKKGRFQAAVRVDFGITPIVFQVKQGKKTLKATAVVLRARPPVPPPNPNPNPNPNPTPEPEPPPVNHQPPQIRLVSPVNGLRTNRDVTLVGQATVEGDALSDLTLQVDGGPERAVGFDAAGNFTTNVGLALNGSADGGHVLRLVARSTAGLASVPLDLFVTIDTQAPDLTVALDPASDSMPVGDGATVLTSVTLVGRTEPGAIVSLSGGGTPSVTAGADGRYALPGVGLVLGANTPVVTASDIVGNARSAALSVTRLATDLPNQAPVNFVPDATSTSLGVPLAFRAERSNALTVVDPDAGAAPVQVAIEAAGGTVSLGTTAGLTFDPWPDLKHVGAFGTGIAEKDAGSRAVAFDAAGNMYVSGYLEGAIDFDPGRPGGELTASATQSGFFLKFDPSGALVWARSLQGTASTDATGIAADAQGNVYVTGRYQAGADLDPGPGVLTPANRGGNDIYVLKLDASGNLVWARTAGGSGSENPFRVKTDGSGNVVLIGNFPGTIDFDPGPGVRNLSAGSQTTSYVWKLDASGNFVWAFALGGGSRALAKDLAVDAVGNIALTGDFENTLDLDPATAAANVTSLRDGEVFVARYGPAGNYLWGGALRAAGTDPTYLGNTATGVAFDPQGNLLATGYYQGTIDFDPGPGETILRSTQQGFSLPEAEAYVWKLSPDGRILWARGMPSTDSTLGVSIGSDINGNVYLIGNYSDPTTISTSTGPYTLQENNSFSNTFVAKLDPNGAWQWARGWGSTRYLSLWRGAVSPTGDVAFIGEFAGTVDFDPNHDTAFRTPPTGPDGTTSAAFVTRVGAVIGDGTSDHVVAVRGTLAAVNAALDGMRYEPAAGFTGTGGVRLLTSDLGNSGTGGPKTAAASVEVVVAQGVAIPDPGLAEALRRALGLETADQINTANLATLTTLEADANAVRDLTGIDAAINLRFLRITPSDTAVSGSLTGLGALAQLPNLSELVLVNVGLDQSHLPALAVLNGVRSLDLRDNRITDLPPLTTMRSLQDLKVFGNAIGSYAPLANRAIKVDAPPARIGPEATIADVAAALGHRPLDLAEWVVNTIAYEPSSGLMKGARATLEARQGNAWDQAGLLIELFRASGMTARFVVGRVTAAVSEVEDWLGVVNAAGAAGVLGAAGLHPEVNSLLATFDHAWVEVQIPLGGTPTWVPFDPSWKFRDRQPGIAGIVQAVPFDEAGYFSQVRTQSPVEYYEDQVTQYLASQHPGRSLADVAYDGPIRPQRIPAAPGGLPYSVVTTTAMTDLPDLEQDRLIVSMASGSTPLLSRTFRLPDISLGRVSLAWADPVGGSRSAQLLLDGQPLVGSTAVAVGGTVTVTLQYLGRGDDTPDTTFTGTLPVGKYATVAIDLGQVSETYVERLQAAVNETAFARLAGSVVSRDAEIGGFLQLAAARYLIDDESESRRLAALGRHVVVYANPSLGLTEADTEVDEYPSLMNRFVPRNPTIDIQSSHTPIPIDGDTSIRSTLVRLGLMNGSFAEHALWEQVANSEAISTIKSLQIAAERGIPILDITPANRAALVPQLTLSPSTIDLINRMLDEGRTVKTPRDATDLNAWRGVGFLALRPDGSGTAYISGGIPLGGGSGTGVRTNITTPQGNLPNGQKVGDPIEVANGNVTRDEQDILLPGVGIPLRFARHYGSQLDGSGDLGPGWTHTFGDVLTFADDGSGAVTWTDDNGIAYRFTPDGAGGYLNPPTLFGTFSASGQAFAYRAPDGLTHTFDLQGRLVSIRDRNANGYDLTYDANGRLQTVADAVAPERALTFIRTGDRIVQILDFTGRAWTYGYDHAGRLSSVDSPSDGRTAAYRVEYAYYDDAARADLLRTIVQPDGGVSSYTYYPNRRGFQVVDPTGARHSVSYDLFRNRTRFVDERGEVTLHDYDAQGQAIRTVQADGTSLRTTWNGGLIGSRVDAFGRAESFTYDVLGNVLTKTDADGNVDHYEYDLIFNQLIRAEAPGGRVTSFGLDARGNVVAVTDPLGFVTTFGRDARGQVISETRARGNVAGADPASHTTTFRYDSAGRLLGFDTPLSSESFVYDARGNPIVRTDANGHTSTYEYDLLDRQVRAVDPLGGSLVLSYDTIGNLVTSTDPLGRITRYAYDLRQRLVGTTFADGTSVAMAYDPVGNLVTTVDALGRVTTYAYDARGRQVREVRPDGSGTVTFRDAEGRPIRQLDPNGNVTTWDYDVLGRLVASTDAQGEVTRMEYDAVGNLIRVTDRRGAVTRHVYDLDDRPITTFGPEGYVLTTDYDAEGNAIALTRFDVTGPASIPDDPRTLPEALRRTTSMAYDLLGRLTSTTDALGQSTTTVYDPGGRITSTTDVAGHTTLYGHDPADRLVAITDALGYVTTFEYDAAGNRIRREDANHHVTRYEYDARDRLVEVVDALGGETRTAYDANGDVIAVTDPLGRVTRYGYDTLDRRITAIGPDGGVTRWDYDANGNVEREVDPLGRITRYDYDALDRLSAVTAPDNGLVAYGYDAEGNLTSTLDSLGHLIRVAYDLLGRPISTLDADGRTTRTTYNALGEIVSTEDELGRETRYAYDGLGRPIGETDPLGHTTTSTYTAEGWLERRTDPLGHTTQYLYDLLDRLIETIDPSGAATSRTYDPIGNLASVTDPVGNRTTYEYDELDRLIRETNMLEAARTYVYDAVGNRIRETDRNGAVRTFAFDDSDRLVAERWLDDAGQAVRTLSYGYDLAGQLVSARDPQSDLTFAYDAAGRIASADTRLTPGVPRTVFRYAYDLAGNLTSRADTIGGQAAATTAYGYDAVNRMSRITRSGSGVAEARVDLTYDAAGQYGSWTRWSDAAGTRAVASTAFTIDTDGRLGSLVHANVLGTLASYTFDYDAADRLTRLTDPDGTTDYAYDATDQLTAADHRSSADEAYAYDLNGNRTSSGNSVGTNNQLLADETYRYAYDGEGRRIARTEIATGEVTRYVWDPRGRLVGVSETNATGTVVASVTFAYDALDRRISKAVDPDGDGPAVPTIERFVYDGDQVALRFDGQGKLTNRTLYGPAVDMLLAEEDAAGTLTWALTDHLGSVRDLVDSAGTRVGHITYDGFGQVVEATGRAADTPFGYTGREIDRETGLNYYRARYYDAAVGRFLSEDPLGFDAEDPNLTRYVGNAPTQRIDPMGLEEYEVDWTRVWGGVGVVGSTLQIFGGATFAVATAPTGIGPVAGTIVAVKGADDLQASLRQLITGKVTHTFTYEGVKNLTGNEGAAFVVDAGIDLFGPQAFSVRTLQTGTKLNQIVSSLNHVSQIKAVNNIGKGRNVAIAETRIADQETRMLITTSGKAPRKGMVETPAERLFTTTSVGGHSRAFDSEVKILEKLAKQTHPGTKGTVKLFSERVVCESCSSVVRQFRNARPNIKVEVLYGPRNLPGSVGWRQTSAAIQSTTHSRHPGTQLNCPPTAGSPFPLVGLFPSGKIAKPEIL
ncbi:MAG: hypothetical protein GC206_10505 [Alphaproteobacteria bacterium]|nr:hypothetical protein [Alphaproteobacteria bacterium]